MIDDTPECPVCAGTLFVVPLARVGLTDEYSCAACWTVFNAGTGDPIGAVDEQWRTTDRAGILQRKAES